MSNKAIYFKNLESKLDDRRCRIMATAWQIFHIELKTFIDFLESITITKAIVNELNRIANDEDFSKYNFGGSGLGGHQVNLPQEEKTRMAFFYEVITKIKDQNLLLQTTRANIFSGGSTHISDSVQGFKDQVFLPLYSYIFERVSDGDFLLYLLLRFKFNVEWFSKQTYFKIYEDSMKENTLDAELREFLFNEGIDYPFSTPLTASGRPDMVFHVEEKPIPLEVKIFDPDRGYNKSRIIDGIIQAKRYTDDYNQAIGYIVVFNPSAKSIEVRSDQHPPFLNIGSKQIIIIVIDINADRPTASKEKCSERVIIMQEDIKF